MRVLVTGASSRLLGGVAAALLERGDEVVCLQRRPVEIAGGGEVEQVLADVRDAEAVARAVAGCDAVVHGAARVGVVGTWEDYRSVNVDGTANLLAACRRHGVARLVHVSSPSVAHGGEPIVGAGADPAVIGRRRAWYAESKALAERLVLAGAPGEAGAPGGVDAAGAGGTGVVAGDVPGRGGDSAPTGGEGPSVVVIRPHLVWGPGDTQLVGRIVERARAGRLVLVGGGRALVDTTYVDNAVDAHLAALDAVGPGASCEGRAYVIANGEPRPIRDLVAGICAAHGVPFEPRDVPAGVARGIGSIVERVWPLAGRMVGEEEPPLTRFLAEQLGTAHWFDPRPARDDLGWTPRISVDEGLTRLAAAASVATP